MRALLRHHWVRKVHLLPARGILSHIHGPFQAHRSPIRGCMRPLKLQMAWKKVSRLLQRCSHFEGSGWTMSITILRKVCNYPNQVSRVFWCQGPLFLHIFFFSTFVSFSQPKCWGRTASYFLIHYVCSIYYSLCKNCAWHPSPTILLCTTKGPDPPLKLGVFLYKDSVFFSKVLELHELFLPCYMLWFPSAYSFPEGCNLVNSMIAQNQPHTHSHTFCWGTSDVE